MAGRRWGFGGRADAFAAALDGTIGPASDTDARLVALVGRLRAVPEPPAAMRAASRAALMSAATVGAFELARNGSGAALHAAAATTSGSAQVTAGATTGTATFAAGTTASTAAGTAAVGGLAGLVHAAAAPFIAAATVTALTATGIGIAAHRATPGNPFYSIKKGFEQLQLDLADGKTSAAKTRLGFAAARLHEIRQLATTDASALTQKRIAGLVEDVWSNLNAATPALLAGSLPDQQAIWSALNDATTSLNGLTAHLPAALTSTLTTALDQTISLLTSTQSAVGTVLGTLVQGGVGGTVGVPAPSASAGVTVGVPAPGLPTAGPTGVGVPPVSVPPISVPPLGSILSGDGGLVGGLVGGLLPPAPTPQPTGAAGSNPTTPAQGGIVAPVTSAAGGLLCQLLRVC